MATVSVRGTLLRPSQLLNQIRAPQNILQHPGLKGAGRARMLTNGRKYWKIADAFPKVMKITADGEDVLAAPLGNKRCRFEFIDFLLSLKGPVVSVFSVSERVKFYSCSFSYCLTIATL